MFSVKVTERVRDEITQEVVFEARQVKRFIDHTDNRAKVSCDVEDGVITYDFQEVGCVGQSQTMYVMNTHGSTVAVYHLG